MFFVHRGEYVAANGTTFRQFLEQGWNGHSATMDDWALHLSTLFPEARMKKFIEVRGCDASTVPMITTVEPKSGSNNNNNPARPTINIGLIKPFREVLTSSPWRPTPYTPLRRRQSATAR